MSSESDEENRFVRTLQRSKISRQLCDFIERYPNVGRSREPVYHDDKFQKHLKLVCENLSKMEFSYSNPGTSMNTVFLYANQILTHLTNADLEEPFSFADYLLYLKLATVIERLRNVLFDCDIRPMTSLRADKYFNAKIEEHLVETYRSKVQHYIANGYEDKIKVMNACFTNFLLEFIKLIPKSNGRLSLTNSIELLFEVADLEILMIKFHKISSLISIDMKISMLKNITKSCLKNNYSLEHSMLLISDDNNFKVELLILTYFAIQHLCEFLKIHKLNQSFQLLSKTSIDIILSAHIPIVLFDSGSETVNVEQELILKDDKNIKIAPSSEIKNCLSMLKALTFSLKKHDLNWCDSRLRIVLLSLLFEFVVATDLDKSCITPLIDINIDITSDLPNNFKAGSYALKIYQKLKSDCDLEYKAKELFKKMSINNAQLSNTKPFAMSDLKKVFRCKENWTDVSVVASCFLSNSVTDEDEKVTSLFYALNECVILTSQNTPLNSVLIYPFSLALNRSLVSKNDDCLYNNLAIFDNYFDFVMNKNEIISKDDRKDFLNVIVTHHKDIIRCLPNESTFLVNCWELAIDPLVMDLSILKELLQTHSSTTFSKFIDSLKMETILLIGRKEPMLNEDYYTFIADVWSNLLNMTNLINKTKKVRKDLVNHFCYTLNRTFLFQTDKVSTEPGLILLLQIVTGLLQVPWINIMALMNCSLRIITFVEKYDISNVKVLLETTELLIVLYKCPNNSIKPSLGVYVITFANVVKKCCAFAKNKKQAKKLNMDAPFHKLVKCSNLFRQNKNDFIFIGRYTLESLLEVITIKNNLPDYLMNSCHSIVHNLMDICVDDELRNLATTARGPAGETINRAYRDYTLHFRFNGRL